MPPRFRTACLIAGGLYVVIGAAILIRGAAASMADYGVPPETLASPHYVDSTTWVYVHTVVLGVLVALVGGLARSAALKLWFSRAMVAAHLVYGALDMAHSEPLGDGLYRGPASIAPAVIGLLALLLFVGPSVRREEPAE